MTSVSVHGGAGSPGGPLMIALDGPSPAPGVVPGDAVASTHDGFHNVLSRHINNINKRPQDDENKEQTIAYGSVVVASSSKPETIDGELLANSIGFQTGRAGRLDQGYPGEPGFGAHALARANLAGSGGGKELPTDGEALPSAAAARMLPAGGAGLGSGALQFNGGIAPQTFAAMKELALSGQGTLAQLAAASGRSKEELLRDPRLLLQAAAGDLTAGLPGVPAAARAASLVPVGSAGLGPTSEPGSVAVGARDAASVSMSPAIAPAIGDGASGSTVAASSAATGFGAAEVSARESLGAMAQRAQGNATGAGAPVGGAENSVNSSALSAAEQAGVAIPFERMVSGRNQQLAGSSPAVVDNMQSPGTQSEDGRELTQSPGLVAPGSEQDQRIAAMALSATRTLQDALDSASDQRVAAQPAVPVGLHGASLMPPAPRIDAAAAGATVAALPLASGDWGERLGERIRWLSSANMDAVDIRLDPPELGPLQVKVQSHRDGASVQFVTHSALVRDMVEQSLPRLREMLEASGMNLLDVNVAQQQDGGGRGQREALTQNASYADPVLALDTAADLPGAARTPRGLVDYYA